MDYQLKMVSINGEYEQDDCSKLGAEFSSTLEDNLCSFKTTTMEVDVSLEWLSAFVEECLSAKGSSLPLPPPQLSTHHNNPPTTPHSLSQPTTPSSDSPFSHFAAVPGKARSKTRRVPPDTSICPLVGRRLQLNLLQNKHSLELTSSSVSFLQSNSHKRVMEMRMINASSSTSTAFPSSS